MPISKVENKEIIYHLDGQGMTVGTITEILRQATQEDGFNPESEMQFDNKNGAVKITRITAIP